MNFGQALEALKAGYKVRLSHWSGYWVRENDTVMMYCKDGSVIDIRQMQDVFYTLGNIASEDWELVDDCNFDLNVHTFSFGEAIRRLRAGQKVARKGWNGKGMYLYLVHGTTVDKEYLRNEAHAALAEDEIAMHNTGVAEFLPHIDMRTANGDVCVGWLASQTDMLAEDWEVVK